jgi:hypothetical protein
MLFNMFMNWADMAGTWLSLSVGKDEYRRCSEDGQCGMRSNSGGVTYR